MPSLYSLMGVSHPQFDPDHRFVTSWLVSPLVLAILRLFLATYCFTTIFVTWGWDGSHHLASEIRRSFSYFTDITYWGLSFYLLVAGTHTLVYALKGESWLDCTWPRPLQALHALFYTSIVNFPFLVTLVFWVVLYDGPWFKVEAQAFSNVSRHGLNSLFALVELVLPATNPPPWLHLAFLIVLVLLYLALAYLTHATQGFYVYSFLDPGKGSGRVTAYCFGIAAGVIVIFVVVWGLIWLRRRFTRVGKQSKKSHKAVNGGAESLSTTAQGRAGDVEMLVQDTRYK